MMITAENLHCWRPFSPFLRCLTGQATPERPIRGVAFEAGPWDAFGWDEDCLNLADNWGHL